MIKIIVTGTLKNLTALHCGSAVSAFHTDMPIARDGAGNPYIPGTSLAGALRDYLKAHLGDYRDWYADFEPEWWKLNSKKGSVTMPSAAKLSNGKDEHPLIRNLFGYQFGEEGHSSRVFVEDAVCEGPTGVAIRDHVVIFRETGSAVPGLKFDEEVVQAGSAFSFFLEVNIPKIDDCQMLIDLVSGAVCALQNGHIHLGGKTSRGMGRVELTVDNALKWDLTLPEDFNGYQAFLGDLHTGANTYQTPQNNEFKLNPLAPNEDQAFLDITLSCGFDGPFMVKSGAVSEKENAEVADLECLKERDPDGNLRFLIPGSSLKGAFRAQAERIVRMVQGTLNDNSWFHPLLLNDTTPLNMENFANYLKNRRTQNLEPPEVVRCFGDPQKGQGSFHFQDVYFEAKTKATNHVAIDPLTGGAINGALYSMQPVWDEAASFEMTIQVRRPQAWQIGLLGHILKDLFTGRFRIGHGGSKGLGRIVFKGVSHIDWYLDGFERNAEKILSKNPQLNA
nr:RAMP superfamily CRISPR-associated protein [Calditrichia bacterium]